MIEPVRSLAVNTKLTPSCVLALLSRCSAEPADWHYTPSARLQQTQTPVPEQYFDSIANADKHDNIRASLADYEYRVSSNIAAEVAAIAANSAQRVATKQTQKGAYLNVLAGRLAKDERDLGNGPPPPMQW